MSLVKGSDEFWYEFLWVMFRVLNEVVDIGVDGICFVICVWFEDEFICVLKVIVIGCWNDDVGVGVLCFMCFFCWNEVGIIGKFRVFVICFFCFMICGCVVICFLYVWFVKMFVEVNLLLYVLYFLFYL